MSEDEKKRLFDLLRILQDSPDMSYFVSKGPTGGLMGCAVWSAYLSDLSFKIRAGATEMQIKKLRELSDSYKLIVQDLNESYLIYLMYCDAKKKYKDQARENEILNREIAELKKENEKLQKSLNFEP